MFSNQERWSLRRCQSAYPNEFRGRWTPQSSRPVIPVSPARRIRVPVSAAAVFVHALHAELSSSTSLHDQPRRKIRLRSEGKVPDQQQQDSILDAIHQAEDQWWALWTFRPSSYFLSVNRRYLTRVLDPKNRIKGIFSKKSEWLEKGIKNSLS